ncbi:hypothetical protein N5079_01765 [Planotetraspora sp. A-T 1434]|uniref:hypothetical protein n=1 Tax=Planotetraspora sp. A-T 1434 TaxID=2979219 RepID=UPI0021BE09A1|nr:hypothetical protein [Planotetraspora sp. A-T 1434]MCT9928940.1 hypothetical protein [Planotetraspora sp. A-T 1434]
MSDPQIDPAGNTQAFRAFAQNQDAAASKEQPSRLPLWLAVGAVIVVALAVVAYLLVS